MRKLSFLSLVLAVLFLASCAQQTSAGTSGSELKTLLKDSSKPAVIKFYASWCSSCKQYKPIFEQVKASMNGTVDFIEIDVDESKYKKLVKELKIARIPETVFVTKDRASFTKRLGPLPANMLTDLIRNLKAS